MLPPPQAISHRAGIAPSDDWSQLRVPVAIDPSGKSDVPHKKQIEDRANADIRRQPELPQHEEVVQRKAEVTPEFAFGEEESREDAVWALGFSQQARSLARQAAIDPGYNLKLGV